MASTTNIRTYEATKIKRKPHTPRRLLLAEIDFNKPIVERTVVECLSVLQILMETYMFYLWKCKIINFEYWKVSQIVDQCFVSFQQIVFFWQKKKN